MPQIFEMDFHYHAGQERNEKSLRDHLQHAAVTGRKIVGITDHYGQYLPSYGNPDRKAIYPRTFQGLRQYARELDSLRGEFPDIVFYFAPELGPGVDFAEVPDEVLRLSDYFICEPTGVKGTARENTDRLIERMQEIAEFSKTVQKEVYLAHPFRASVNVRLVNGPITPETTAMWPKDSLDRYDPEEIERFFMLDVLRIGKEAADLGIGLEINGETHNRIRVTNLPAPLKLMWAAYFLMKNQGARFVPGSDQHDFETGRYGTYVPYDCFEAIGVRPEDVRFMSGAGKPLGCPDGKA